MPLRPIFHCVIHLGTLFLIYNVFLARENVLQRTMNHISDESGVGDITMHQDVQFETWDSTHEVNWKM